MKDLILLIVMLGMPFLMSGQCYIPKGKLQKKMISYTHEQDGQIGDIVCEIKIYSKAIVITNDFGGIEFCGEIIGKNQFIDDGKIYRFKRTSRSFEIMFDRNGNSIFYHL